MNYYNYNNNRTFLFPFLLGGLAGGVVGAYSRPRPVFVTTPYPSYSYPNNSYQVGPYGNYSYSYYYPYPR